MSVDFSLERCTRCGQCVRDCVCGIIALGADGAPCIGEEAAKHCVHCGHCLAVCPAGAVSLDGVAPEQCRPTDTGISPDMGKQALRALLLERRAVRQYSGTSVPPALLEQALGYANYAPTAHNNREVAYIVLNGRDKVESLLVATVALMESHGLFPAHVANVKQGCDTLFRGAPCLVLLHAPERVLSEADCATAAAYLELALHGLGLGSCWAGMLIEACVHGLPDGIVLPQGRKLYAALMVGERNVSYPRIPSRTPPTVFWR